jgi:hypothetical protein
VTTMDAVDRGARDRMPDDAAMPCKTTSQTRQTFGLNRVRMSRPKQNTSHRRALRLMLVNYKRIGL